MTPSTIFQALNNVSLPQQSGGEVVAQQTITLGGSDVLIGVSASAWSEGAGPMSIDVWLDGQPTGARLAMYANFGQMHMSLGHTWAWIPSPAPGDHVLTLVAGDTTITDQNDYACATVWEMGDGGTVHFSGDAPCPSGTGEQLVKEAVHLTGGKTVMISASTSGWVTQSQGSFIGAGLTIDSGNAFELEVCANNLDQHLAAVATDLIDIPQAHGQHLVQLTAAGNTSTDQGDTAHLTVVELSDDENSPAMIQHLQNDPANSQQGDGGSIISAPFQSAGGTLLVRVSLSVWTQAVGAPLYVGIQVDGTSLGFAQIWANSPAMHMPTVTNDLVLQNIPEGDHMLNLMAEADVITDYNDRVSVTVLEFPS